MDDIEVASAADGTASARRAAAKDRLKPPILGESCKTAMAFRNWLAAADESGAAMDLMDWMDFMDGRPRRSCAVHSVHKVHFVHYSQKRFLQSALPPRTSTGKLSNNTLVEVVLVP